MDILIDAVGNIDDEIIDEYIKNKSELQERSRRERARRARYGVIIAACAAVVIITGSFALVMNTTSPDDGTQEVTSGDQCFTMVPDDTTPDPDETVFSSFAEFEEYEKSAGTSGLSHYYVPGSLPDGSRLEKIVKLKDVSVFVRYSVPEFSDDVICEYYLSDDREGILKGYINAGAEAFEFNGKTCYRRDLPDAMGNGICAYEIFFLDDGELIRLRLPGVDTFDNMMKYIGITKIDIK